MRPRIDHTVSHHAAFVRRAAIVAAALALALGAVAITRREPARGRVLDPPSPEAAGARAMFVGPYPARIVRVVDGDTFEARLTVWFGQDVATLVRLRGVDAPERAARCGAEAEGAQRAARALDDLLSSGRVALTNVAGDKYFGRVVADAVVSAPDGAFPPTQVGPALIAQGVARSYAGRARESWCAARQARANP